MHFETRCVHVGVDKDTAFNSCTTPIYPTSTFRWDDLKTNRGYDYTRSGNPTRTGLSKKTSRRSKGGSTAGRPAPACRPSSATMHLFEPGDHIIAGHDIYGGTYRLFADVLTAARLSSFRSSTWGIRKRPQGHHAPQPSASGSKRPAIRCSTSSTWPPSRHRQGPGRITIADNTFLSPYLQRPFEHGRRHRDSLDDEVPQRALRRRRRLRRHASTRSTPSESATSSTRWGWPVRRSTPGWCCAA